MTRVLYALPFMLSITVLAGCGDTALAPLDPLEGPLEQLPRALTDGELRLVEADNAFGLDLFREINTADPETNLFLSPLSVAMALGMAYNGAAGETKVEMAHVLGLEGMDTQEVNASYRGLIDLLFGLDAGVQFNLANSIWVRQGIPVEPSFLDVNREYFAATVRALDFAEPSSSDIMNDWVSDETQGKITDIVPPDIPIDVVMYLINALFFKGDWRARFDKDLTQDRAFTLLDGTEVSVPTMIHREDVDLRVFGNDLVLAVEMPYSRGAFAMTVAVPRDGVHIDEVIDALDGATWHTWISSLQETGFRVAMPKFTLEYGTELMEPLQALGMRQAFTENVADFSKIRAANDLSLSRAIHKTFVDVNEDGTEAAAATVVGARLTCGPPTCPGEFRVDRPFVFAIRETFSGTILFLRKIVNPTG